MLPPALRSRPIEEVECGVDLLELVLDPVAILHGFRLLEFLDELLLPRQQVLYDCTHKTPIAPKRASGQKPVADTGAGVTEARTSVARAGA